MDKRSVLNALIIHTSPSKSLDEHQTREAALLEGGFEVIGPANSAEEAIALARRETPDLVIMNIRLVGPRDGIDAAREVFRSTGIRSLFATAHSTPEILRRAQDTAPLAWLSNQ